MLLLFFQLINIYILPHVKLIPWKHFGRKNVGFLYAIIHGAKASMNNVKHIKGPVTPDIL
jgi:hypothetical protein